MSRRNGTSCGPPRRITGAPSGALNLFSELDPVAVRVEHVDDPHRVVQLEYDSDVDPLLPEPLGVGLDVVDVDHCDAALGLGLARGQPDHRPAARKPDEVLRQLVHREPQRAGVEGPSCVEVTDAVPDHSASAGSSKSSLSVWRNPAAGAPSAARWSNVATSVIIGRTAAWPFTATTRSSVAPTATIAA